LGKWVQWGYNYDESLGEEMRVLIVMCNFESYITFRIKIHTREILFNKDWVESAGKWYICRFNFLLTDKGRQKQQFSENKRQLLTIRYKHT